MATMTSGFDPYRQNVTFHSADGIPFNVPIGAVDSMIQYAVRICINYGSQLGASLMLLVILLLLTRPEKRRSYVFCLNCAALLLNFGRLLCGVLFFTTDFAFAYPYFSGDYSSVPTSAYVNSILAAVLSSMLLLCIETSLVLQVQVVCGNLRHLYRRTLLGLSAMVALAPISIRLWYMVENIKNIIHISDPAPLIWLESLNNIVVTVSICFFCAVFIMKLGFAMRLRKQLGLKEFGPMKVIFIMGCQTMIIPALVSIMHYAISVPELPTNVLTLTTLFLPLSSIWAGKNLGNPSSHLVAHRSPWHLLSTVESMNDKRDSISGTSLPSGDAPKLHAVCYSESDATAGAKRAPISQTGIAVEHNISVKCTRRNPHESV